jgi:hypothetical protein
MKVLCIRPRHNTPGKKDVTGAFAPEAEKFLKLQEEGSVVTFDNHKGMQARRREVLEIISDHGAGTLDAVVFFCHGWSKGIQAGFARAHVPTLAAAIDGASAGHVEFAPNVILYCCSTGDDPQDRSDEAAGTGDNSFADRLRDALCAVNPYCRVTAHDTVAHTTKNPYALFFDGMGSAVGGAGGYYPVAPGGPLWAKWRRKLRETNLRFRFPFMSVEEIHRELVVNR